MRRSRAISVVAAGCALAACTTVLDIDSSGPGALPDGGQAPAEGGPDAPPGGPTVVADKLVEARSQVVLAGYVYFTRYTKDGAILRVPTAGGPPTEVARGDVTNLPVALAASGAGVYWGASLGNEVKPGMRWLPIGGGGVVDAPKDGAPAATAVEGLDLFYTVPQPSPGRVYSDGLTLDGQDDVVNPIDDALFIAVNGPYLYTASSKPGGSVAQAELDGAARKVVDKVDDVTALAAGRDRVLWATGDTVFAAEAAGFPVKKTLSAAAQKITGIVLLDDPALTYFLLDAAAGQVLRGDTDHVPVPLAAPRCTSASALVRDGSALYAACGDAILRIPF